MVADFIRWYDVHIYIIQASGGPKEAPGPEAVEAEEVEGPAAAVAPVAPGQAAVAGSGPQVGSNNILKDNDNIKVRL